MEVYQIRNIAQKVNLTYCIYKKNCWLVQYFHCCSAAWSNAAPFRLNKIDKKVVDASIFLGREDNYSIYDLVNKDQQPILSLE